MKGVKIGILTEGLQPPIMDSGVKDQFLAAVKIFKNLGADVEEVSVPIPAESRTLYTVVSKMGNHMGMLGRATGRKGLIKLSWNIALFLQIQSNQTETPQN